MIRALVAMGLAVMALAGQPFMAQGDTTARVDVLTVASYAGDQLSLVAALSSVPPVPLDANDVTVTSDGTTVPSRVRPVLSDATAIGLVIDASAEGSRSIQGGGLAGAAGFLLQTPPGASTAVIADRRPPAVVATSLAGATDDVRAVSALRSGGARATSDALRLAARELPPSSGRQPVIVLLTSAPNAGGEAADALGERLRRANVILAVVTTGPDQRYWGRAAAATGGIAVKAQPAEALDAFDEVADALRARYVVTFPRPSRSDAQLTVRSTTSDAPVVASFALPSASTSTAESGTAGPSAWIVVVGIVGSLAVGVAVTAVVLALRRRRMTSGAAQAAVAPPPPREDVPAPDTRPVLDPPEEFGSLFEETSVREARKASQVAAARRSSIPANHSVHDDDDRDGVGYRPKARSERLGPEGQL